MTIRLFDEFIRSKDYGPEDMAELDRHIRAWMDAAEFQEQVRALLEGDDDEQE